MLKKECESNFYIKLRENNDAYFKIRIFSSYFYYYSLEDLLFLSLFFFNFLIDIVFLRMFYFLECIISYYFYIYLFSYYF